MLLVGLSFSCIKAENNPQNKNTVILEYLKANIDGSFEKNKLELSQIEFNNLRDILNQLIESLQNLTQNASILKAILNFVKEKFPNLYNLFENIIGNIRAKLSRYFIISSGTGYKLNPFKKDSITFSKRPMTIWAYSRNGKPVGSTFIKYPLSLCTETYKGRQIGWMTDFSGIYIYNAKNFPEQSYTFFIGKADNVKIFELPGLFR